MHVKVRVWSTLATVVIAVGFGVGVGIDIAAGDAFTIPREMFAIILAIEVVLGTTSSCAWLDMLSHRDVIAEMRTLVRAIVRDELTNNRRLPEAIREIIRTELADQLGPTLNHVHRAGMLQQAHAQADLRGGSVIPLARSDQG